MIPRSRVKSGICIIFFRKVSDDDFLIEKFFHIVPRSPNDTGWVWDPRQWMPPLLFFYASTQSLSYSYHPTFIPMHIIIIIRVVLSHLGSDLSSMTLSSVANLWPFSVLEAGRDSGRASEIVKLSACLLVLILAGSNSTF